MKALPVKVVQDVGYVRCAVEEATHVTINIPGPCGQMTFPIILSGKREGTHCWTWNGDCEKPTLKPSLLTTGNTDGENGGVGKPFKCHTWINDGTAIFLDDTSHELRGQTVPLLEVTEKD